MKKVAILIPYLREQQVHVAVHAAIDNAQIPREDYEVWIDTEKKGDPRIGVTKMFNWMVKAHADDVEMVAYLADDTIAQPGWLRLGLQYMERFEEGFGVVGFADGITQRPLPFHFLAHKKMLPLLGGDFLHEGYRHTYCDNELYERCTAMNRYFWAEDAVVYHQHPMLLGKEMDEHYTKAYAHENGVHDFKLFERRKANNWSNLV